MTAPEEASVIADAWLEQEHGKPPVGGSKEAGGEAAPPEWWSAEVEQGHNSIESQETFQWSVVKYVHVRAHSAKSFVEKHVDIQLNRPPVPRQAVARGQGNRGQEPTGEGKVAGQLNILSRRKTEYHRYLYYYVEKMRNSAQGRLGLAIE